MASFTLDEQIIGIPLFVPDARGFFAIDSGGMPNGDNCLIVQGNVNSTYLAYQNVPTTVPPLFTTRNPADWSMSFWYKSGALPAVVNQRVLMTIGNPLANANTYSFGIAAGSANRLHTIHTTQLLLPTRYGIQGSRTLNSTANQTGASVTGQIRTVDDNNWHLIVMNWPERTAAPGTPTAYIDLDTVGSVGNSGSQLSAGSSVITTPQYFSIGCLSALQTALDIEYRLGKIAFHNHLLNATERALLYNSMVP